jgi:hypothetical protein
VHGTPIDGEFFVYAFMTWPGVRDALLRYVAKSVNPFKYVECLAEALESGHIVDNSTPLKMAVAVCSARYTTKFPANCLDRLISALDNTCPFGAFAHMWLLSRFSDRGELRKVIDATSDTWSKEPILLRGVAGFLPLFRGAKDVVAFTARLTRLGGRTATAVFNFYSDFIFEKSGFSKVSSFIGKPNPSMATGITHPKFLMLYGFLSNTGYTKQEKAKFLLKHPQIRRDLYYRSRIFPALDALP